jgi:hypothetical protein
MSYDGPIRIHVQGSVREIDLTIDFWEQRIAEARGPLTLAAMYRELAKRLNTEADLMERKGQAELLKRGEGLDVEIIL